MFDKITHSKEKIYKPKPPLWSMSTDPEPSEEDIMNTFRNLIDNTGYLAVFSIVSLLKSIHLSRIARLIGKSKSTILSTIDSMLEESNPVIEVDIDTTINTRGVKKYYQLSQFGETMQDVIDQFTSNFTTPSPEEAQFFRDITHQEYVEFIKNEVKSNMERYGEKILLGQFNIGSELNYYFQRSASQSYIELGKSLNDGKTETDLSIPYGSFLSHLQKIKVSSMEQVSKLKQLMQQFIADVNKLKEEMDGENQERIDAGDLSADDLDGQIVFVNLFPILDYEQ